MVQELSVISSDEDRVRLEAIVGDRNRLLKQTQRARIVLLSAERLPVLQVAVRAGVSRPVVWRWQRRYAEAGVEGLLRDKTRPPGKKPVAIETVNKVLALTCGEPTGEMTHWTGRAMAKTVGLALNTAQQIWKTNRLQRHRLRTFKRSTDPALAEKVEDIVGLYVHPPAHAVVLSIDEKSQIRHSIAPSPACRSSPANAEP
jgi:transposase